MIRFILIIFALFLSSSCVKNQEKRGYVFELSDYQLLQQGLTNKETVIKTMGSPTIISSLDNYESWIYYSEEVSNVLFFMPDVEERMIITLKFGRDDVVNSLEKFSLSDEDEKLSFNSKYTEVSSNKIGFFKSLFSNVGQIKAAQ